jgi:hypothetical protein
MADVLESFGEEFEILRYERQRQIIFNDNDAIEASGLVQGEGVLDGQNVFIYTLITRQGETIYWFVGVTLEENAEVNRIIFEYMGQSLKIK